MDSLLKEASRLTGVHTPPISLDQGIEELASRFAHLPGTVLLLSGGDLDCSRHHLLGVLPWLTIEGWGHETRLTLDGQATVIPENGFKVLRAVLNRFDLPKSSWPTPLAAGLMGYLAYDLKDCLEVLPKTSVDDTHLPHMLFYAPSILVVHDRQDNSTRLMVPQRSSHRKETEACLERFHKLAARPPAKDDWFGANIESMQSNVHRKTYEKMVKRVIDFIAAGDVYQVNISQRFRMPFEGSAYGLFRHLFARNPAPFFSYIQAGDHQVVSTSPERFLLRDGAGVETRPIKGTRPRKTSETEDLAMREELAASKKDDAELSMIVDLLRNDIGKVCREGSVKVTEHKRLEAYENVYHLVSVVEGELDADKDSVDLIEATFPGGSITGCPKVRAMEIIDELESSRRHVYCGSIGYLSFHDTMDLSIAIRTATITNGIISYSVGGGIVFDSDPGQEYQETLHKGRTLTNACKSSRLDLPVPRVWINGRLAAADQAAVPIDDQGLLYGYGFFETIRVDRGQAPLLANHLLRFQKSWQALMPCPFPDLAWADVIDQVIEANGFEQQCAAVKILATRGSRTAAPWDHTLLVSARPYTHRLTALDCTGLHLGTYPHARQTPLAAHKTLNYLYYLQAGQWAAANGFHEALILNPDDSVSETNTANLLLIDGKQVVRPQSPAVLSGVMAQTIRRSLEQWGYRVTERLVTVDELHRTQRLVAANALMGAASVNRIDHRERPAAEDLCARLNDAIIPGWRDHDHS